MKRSIHLFFYLLTTGLLLATGTMAQTGLAPNQNPNYMLSRDKYMAVADSINAYHGITVQDTYNSIDFLEDRREARDQRRAFRRELRLIRAQNAGYYYDDYYSPYNYNYNNYYPIYNNRSYRYGRGWNSYNYNYRRTVPLAITLGSLAWWMCR